jgi:hypothetical protein
MKKILIPIALCLAFGCKNSEQHAESSAKNTQAIYQDRAAAAEAASPEADQEIDNRKRDKTAPLPPLANGKKAMDSAQPVTKILIPTSTYSTPLRKIIRTAQVKSKVENTEQASYQIEQMARKFNGFVTQTHLESRNLDKSETPISQDSTLEITQFEVGNTIALRVPNQNLDTFLTELSRLYTHLDYRNVNAQDLTATFLTNQLKSQLRDNSAQRIAQASDEKGKRLSDITNAEETRVNLKDAAIEQQIQNLETDYDIAFSVVNIDIYQNAVVAKTMKTNANNRQVASNFGFRLTQALSNGWSIVLDILLFFVNLWAFILLSLGAFWVYRKIKTQGFAFSK